MLLALISNTTIISNHTASFVLFFYHHINWHIRNISGCCGMREINCAVIITKRLLICSSWTALNVTIQAVFFPEGTSAGDCRWIKSALLGTIYVQDIWISTTFYLPFCKTWLAYYLQHISRDIMLSPYFHSGSFVVTSVGLD